MYMSVVASRPCLPVYPELAGARVLLTGLTSAIGVDIARAFADHKARLVVQSPDNSPAMTELVAVLAETAAEIRLFNDPLADASEAMRLAQTAAQEMGGLDLVINLVAIDEDAVAPDAPLAEVEAAVSDALLGAVLATRVAANRMRLTWCQGAILNVVALPQGAKGHVAAMADIAYATLGAVTRGEAKEWAEHGIRINGAAPRRNAEQRCNAAEADMAALALYLASRKGRGLSGHLFDADGIAAARCA